MRSAMRRGIGEGIDNLQLLDDLAGPAVRDDEGQRIVMFRTHVDEVNVESIDFGDELRQCVQPGLALTPVVRNGETSHGGQDGAALEVFAMVATFVCRSEACRVRRRGPARGNGDPSLVSPLPLVEACPTKFGITSRLSYGECGGPMGCRVML